MYLYLGNETVVKSDEIIGIFDIENTSVSKITKDYLRKTQKSDKIIVVSPDIPKSFVVCDKGVCLSQISPATLKKRTHFFI